VQPEAEDTQIIDPHDVIGVCMCHHCRANQRGSFPDQLQPQLGACVNDKFSLGGTDQHTSPHATIPGIIRQTDIAATTDNRDTDTGAGSHDDHFADAFGCAGFVVLGCGQVTNAPRFRVSLRYLKAFVREDQRAGRFAV
jgi:hypothetical protein